MKIKEISFCTPIASQLGSDCSVNGTTWNYYLVLKILIELFQIYPF